MSLRLHLSPLIKAAVLGAALVVALPTAEAAAQSRGGFPRGADDGRFPDRQRQDQAREEAREGQRMELGDIIRRVQAGRPGRMLGVRPSGPDYVVRWEYPGGRVADIRVDGRSGRVTGEN